MARLHVCHCSDGMPVACFCVRGVDHNEAEFDVPLEDPIPEDPRDPKVVQ